MALVVSIDAGTTGVRAVAVGEDARLRAARYREFPQYFPRPGWVEHDPGEIWEAVAATLTELLDEMTEPLAAIGITNQRETAIVWDRRTGSPLHRALVWQDRRTAARCEQLEAAGHLPLVRARTGLVLDPYFSATKLGWLFSEGGVEPGPDVVFGTVDSWLIWKLTGGRVHTTDASNAARTLLFDIRRMAWDPELAELFGVPMTVLPEVGPSSGRLGTTAEGVVRGLPQGIPISGVAGDQQASLFGQACFEEGMTKNTYGTGSFVLMNVGPVCPEPADGLLTTVAWVLGSPPGVVAYAMEGSIFVTGAALQWLRDGLGVVETADDAAVLAGSVSDAGGAYLVPAFTGLGSPWWDPHGRGTVVGLSRGVGRAHLARAAVEAMAYQTRDVVDAMVAAVGRPIAELRVDGGASVMDLLLQLQADLLGVQVVRAGQPETTVVGAAMLAGLAEGVWGSLDDIARCWSAAERFTPAVDRAAAEAAHAGWGRAVERSRRWATLGSGA